MAKRTFPLKWITEDGEESWMTWTLPTKNPSVQLVKVSEKSGETLVDEVEKAVEEWYLALNEPVPASDRKWIEVYRKAEKEEEELWQKELQTPVVIVEKIAFGTPDYWKDYWAKKKAAGYVTKKDAAASAAATAAKTSPKSKKK